ncbi:MAG: threonine synthase [Planctomycetota bacterium]
MSDAVYQQCTNPACAATFDAGEVLTACPICGALLDVRYDWDRLPVPTRLKNFDARRMSFDPLDVSGVWRFRELLPFFRDTSDIVTVGEGRTTLQTNDSVACDLKMPHGTLQLQYEGFNPSGSFKDNGMTAAFTHAKRVGAAVVACASTGNTSAALALYASAAGMKALVFVGSGKIAFGKLSQALDYGAMTLQVEGDFDDCLKRVRELAETPDAGVYLMNSVNPFRLEGQKAIMYRILEARGWQVPDWIVVPGGNLGNSSAFGKAFAELFELGLIDRIPRLAIINAHGANTLWQLYEQQGLRWNDGGFDKDVPAALYRGFDAANHKADTVASAIEIGRPVNLPKALRALDIMNGVVREVDDDAILDGRATVARFGFGCEPASGATIAGLRQLLDEGVISRGEQVVCVLTGHELKDPNRTVDYHIGDEPHRWSNAPTSIPNDLDAILKVVQQR